MKSINQETPITMFAASALVVGCFALYQIFAPTIEMVKVNSAEISNHKNLIRAVHQRGDSHSDLLLKISNSLSRIEGKMEK